MAWKHRYHSRSSTKGEWSGSGDEHAFHRMGSTPAACAEEALWRAVKRITSAARWLKLDLALLAESKRFARITCALEGVINMFGQELLPELGRAPIPLAQASRSEVLDLVNVLCSISNEVGKDKEFHRDAQVQTETYKNEAPFYTSTADAATQAANKYMVRFGPKELTGEWQPLDGTLIRRGALLHCIAPVTTDSADVYNYTLQHGQYCKVIDIDSDGDARVVILSPVDCGNLWAPSETRWLLQSEYGAFEQWRPSAALTTEALSRQAHRAKVVSEAG